MYRCPYSARLESNYALQVALLMLLQSRRPCSVQQHVTKLVAMLLARCFSEGQPTLVSLQPRTHNHLPLRQQPAPSNTFRTPGFEMATLPMWT